tara:strand:- start:804 stop:1850 length:1047 start_codon:yes stop_codon:yes gene_type:complete
LRRYIPGPGVDQRVAMVDCRGSASCAPGDSGVATDYYFADRQGNVLAVTSQAGVIRQHFFYTPFGVELVGDPSGNPFRYTGRRYDAETGLYYYRARYYDADLGRFLQVDPVGYADQWNLYAYVGNNPLNATDPTGAYQCSDAGGTTIACPSMVTGAVGQLRDGAANSRKADVRDDLAEIVTFLGGDDEDNGVTVQLGGCSDCPTATADTHSDGSVVIQFKTERIGMANSLEAQQPGGGATLLAPTIAHESRHGIDGRARGNGNPRNRDESMATERNAYTSGARAQMWQIESGALNLASPLQEFNNLRRDSSGVFQVDPSLLQTSVMRSTNLWCSKAALNPAFYAVSGC